jgi:outer membrane lipopolysaccharide assembly protein LptE/RlpB
MRLRSAIAILLLAGALPSLAGCGYSTESLYPKQYKTVHVPMWARGKDVYRRELEEQVTEAVQKRIEAYTPYRLAKKSQADTELTGSIDQIVQRPLSINSDTGYVRELEVTFIVSFKWVDIATGHVIVQRDNFRVAGSYFPESPVSENFFEGSADAIDRLATRVVEQMEKPFKR